MRNKDVKNILKKAVVVPVAGLVIVSVVACGQKPIEGVSTEPTSSIQWETQEAQEPTHEAEADDLLNKETQAEQEETQETQEVSNSFWDPTEFDEADYVQKRLKEGYEAYESYEGSVVAENFKAGEVYTVTGLWDRVENGELVAGLFRIQNEAGEVAYAPNLWFEDVQEEVAEGTEESQGSEEAAEPSEEVAQGGEEEAEPSEEVAQGSQEAPSQETPSQEAPSQEAPSQAPQESQSTQLTSGTYVGGEDRAYAGGIVCDGIWYASNEEWMAAMGITVGSGERHSGTPSDGNYTWE